MNLGFIGTGEITKAVVKGILNSKIKYSKIYLSRRNKNISKYLSRKSKKIIILDNNQKIIDKSNWVFLSITPEVGNEIIKKYQFKKSQIIISFISTIKYNNLKTYIKTSVLLFVPFHCHHFIRSRTNSNISTQYKGKKIF